jgi:hypothetical protein
MKQKTEEKKRERQEGEEGTRRKFFIPHSTLPKLLNSCLLSSSIVPLSAWQGGFDSTIKVCLKQGWQNPPLQQPPLKLPPKLLNS